MNEDPEPEQSGTSPARANDEPSLRLVEPEEMGGESACWAHLLDDEGRLDDRRL